MESMRGKVKWVSVDEGYGFITGDGEEDYYFRVDDVRGVRLPTIGTDVEFDGQEAERGPRAKNIRIVAFTPIESSGRDKDDRVTCTHCGKRMVPRLQYWRGSVMGSNCPFCLQPHIDRVGDPIVNWSRVLKPFKYLGLAFLAFIVLRLIVTVLMALLGEL